MQKSSVFCQGIGLKMIRYFQREESQLFGFSGFFFEKSSL